MVTLLDMASNLMEFTFFWQERLTLYTELHNARRVKGTGNLTSLRVKERFLKEAILHEPRS